MSVSADSSEDQAAQINLLRRIRRATRLAHNCRARSFNLGMMPTVVQRVLLISPNTQYVRNKLPASSRSVHDVSDALLLRCRPLFTAFAMCLFLLHTSCSTSKAIRPSSSVRFPLQGGQSVSYSLHLLSGKYVHVVVEQKGIDLALKISNPRGRTICTIDRWTSGYGAEPAEFISDTTGNYTLKIWAVQKHAAARDVVLSVSPLTDASNADRRRVFELLRAVNIYYEAQQLYAKGRDEATVKALAKFREALRALPDGYPLWRASAWTNIGETLYDTDDFEKSLPVYRQALEYWGVAKELDGEAETLYNIAVDLYQSGAPTDAFTDCHDALYKWERVGDTKGQAIALALLGRIDQSRGQYHSALDDYMKAIPMIESTGDYMWDGYILHDLGMLYFALGDTDGALTEYNKVLAIEKKHPDPEAEAHILHHIGEVYVASSRYSDAAPILARALQIETDDLGRATTLIHMAAVQENQGHLATAMSSAQEALKIRKEQGYELGLPQALLRIGLLYLRMGNTLQARDVLNDARKFSEQLGDESGVAAALDALARTELGAGQLEQAQKYSEGAVQMAEGLRTHITSTEFRALYFSTVHEYFETYIDVLMRLRASTHDPSYIEMALNISERARARSMLDGISGIAGQIENTAPLGLRKEQRDLSEALSTASQQRLQLMAEGKPNKGLSVLQTRIVELNEKLRLVQERIRAGDPRYTAFLASKPYTVPTLQRALDPQTNLLEYFVGTSRSYLWVISRQKLTSFELPGKAELSRLVNAYYDELGIRLNQHLSDEMPVRAAGAKEQLSSISLELSRVLIEPAATLLADKRLAVVLDGPLEYLPFSALPLPQTSSGTMSTGSTHPMQPLITEHEIVELDSASVWLAARKHRRPAGWKKEVASFADPVYNTRDTRYVLQRRGAATCVAGTKSAGIRALSGFARLVFSAKEEDVVERYVARDREARADGFDANLENFEHQDLQQFRFIHLATHAVVDPQSPPSSGIILSLIDKCGHPLDGFLGLARIYNLRMAADSTLR